MADIFCWNIVHTILNVVYTCIRLFMRICKSLPSRLVVVEQRCATSSFSETHMYVAQQWFHLVPSSLLEDFCVYFPSVAEKRYSSICATIVLSAFRFPDWYNYCTLPVRPTPHPQSWPHPFLQTIVGLISIQIRFVKVF